MKRQTERKSCTIANADSARARLQRGIFVACALKDAQVTLARSPEDSKRAGRNLVGLVQVSDKLGHAVDFLADSLGRGWEDKDLRFSVLLHPDGSPPQTRQPRGRAREAGEAKARGSESRSRSRSRSRSDSGSRTPSGQSLSLAALLASGFILEAAAPVGGGEVEPGGGGGGVGGGGSGSGCGSVSGAQSGSGSGAGAGRSIIPDLSVFLDDGRERLLSFLVDDIAPEDVAAIETRVNGRFAEAWRAADMGHRLVTRLARGTVYVPELRSQLVTVPRSSGHPSPGRLTGRVRVHRNGAPWHIKLHSPIPALDSGAGEGGGEEKGGASVSTGRVDGLVFYLEAAVAVSGNPEPHSKFVRVALLLQMNPALAELEAPAVNLFASTAEADTLVASAGDAGLALGGVGSLAWWITARLQEDWYRDRRPEGGRQSSASGSGSGDESRSGAFGAGGAMEAGMEAGAKGGNGGGRRSARSEHGGPPTREERKGRRGAGGRGGGGGGGAIVAPPAVRGPLLGGGGRAAEAEPAKRRLRSSGFGRVRTDGETAEIPPDPDPEPEPAPAPASNPASNPVDREGANPNQDLGEDGAPLSPILNLRRAATPAEARPVSPRSSSSSGASSGASLRLGLSRKRKDPVPAS